MAAPAVSSDAPRTPQTDNTGAAGVTDDEVETTAGMTDTERDWNRDTREKQSTETERGGDSEAGDGADSK